LLAAEVQSVDRMIANYFLPSLKKEKKRNSNSSKCLKKNNFPSAVTQS
jgi:hypothetical protein